MTMSATVEEEPASVFRLLPGDLVSVLIHRIRIDYTQEGIALLEPDDDELLGIVVATGPDKGCFSVLVDSRVHVYTGFELVPILK